MIREGVTDLRDRLTDLCPRSRMLKTIRHAAGNVVYIPMPGVNMVSLGRLLHYSIYHHAADVWSKSVFTAKPILPLVERRF